MAVSAEALNTNVANTVSNIANGNIATDVLDAIGIGSQRRQQEFNSAEAISQRNWEEKQNEIVRAYNSAEAALNREFNSAEAEKQRKWEERLANTAHQREIADLISAGLNPALSVTGGAGSVTPMGSSASGQSASASTPNGASASTSGAINSAGALSSIIGTYANYKIMQKQIRLLHSEKKDLMKAQTELHKTQSQLNMARLNGGVNSASKLKNIVIKLAK